MNPHRSFRLTRSHIKDETPGACVRFSLAMQLVVLGMAAMILDDGMLLQMFSYAAAAQWVCIGIILFRRRNNLTPVDKIVIRVGFLVACVVSVILTPLIWQLRDV